VYNTIHISLFNKFYSNIKFQLALFLMALISLSAIPATAAERSENVATAMRFDAGLNAGNLIQILVALFSVVLIIFALSIVLKKFNIFPGTSSGAIRVIAGISLGSKDRLLLIQIGDEQILLSAGPGNINKIHKLTTPVEANLKSSSEKARGNSFSSLLRSVSSRSRP